MKVDSFDKEIRGDDKVTIRRLPDYSRVVTDSSKESQRMLPRSNLFAELLDEIKLVH